MNQVLLPGSSPPHISQGAHTQRSQPLKRGDIIDVSGSCAHRISGLAVAVPEREHQLRTLCAAAALTSRTTAPALEAPEAGNPKRSEQMPRPSS
jgi:hypothetical protein